MTKLCNAVFDHYDAIHRRADGLDYLSRCLDGVGNTMLADKLRDVATSICDSVDELRKIYSEDLERQVGASIASISDTINAAIKHTVVHEGETMLDLKTPWVQGEDDEFIASDGYTAMYDGQIELDVEGIEDEVVRRVNAHDALVKALRSAKTHMEHLKAMTGLADDAIHNDCMHMCNEALKAAGA